jgi:starch-binding outer membrane protein, SusD/RagB family
MKNISYIKITTVAFLCSIVLSCGNSFLDLAPLSNPNASTFYKTKADIDLAVSAGYSTLYTCYGPLCGASYCGEQMSDNCTMGNAIGAVADKWGFKNYTLLPSNSIVYTLWQQYYSSLFNVNILIDKIDAADVTPEYKTQVKAEMMFIRALYYFNMVQMWGDIPLITKPVTAKESYGVLRSPASEVYTQIISDLEFAIANLPLASTYAVKGKVSKGAAQTLLGKVYLTKGDKTAAQQILLQVYNNGYSLLPNYSDVWVVTNKNSAESIFELQYKGGTGNPYSTYYPAFAPFENFTITSYSEGMNMVTDDLWKEFEPNDPRRNLSIDTGYFKNAVFVPIKFPKKWRDPAITYNNEFCNNNFMVLRYADLLLMLSEATGDAQYLNQVRARVGLPGYGQVGYPAAYSTLDLAIEHERRVELALEFHRWFDLKSTGRATNVLTAKKGKTITADMLLLPIPEKVRQQNPAITQNPGY